MFKHTLVKRYKKCSERACGLNQEDCERLFAILLFLWYDIVRLFDGAGAVRVFIPGGALHPQPAARR